MKQSPFEANTYNRFPALENAFERGTIGSGFVSHWLGKWLEFCQPFTEQVRQNQTKRVITFDTQTRPLYFREPIIDHVSHNAICSS